MTTGAVVEELLRRGIRTIALNVHVGNAAAMRVYGRLGFVPHCEYYECVGVGV
jgi:predicted GNAT family acetyltransferase